MGGSSSTPVPEVFEYVHPIDPNIPIIGAGNGVAPSDSGPFELVLLKALFQYSGGNNYMIRTRPGMGTYHNLAIKGKAAMIFSKDQMDIIDADTKDPVAVLFRNTSMPLVNRFKIYTPVPLFDGQEPTFVYKKEDESKISMYTYAGVNKPGGRGVWTVVMDNAAEGDKPAYSCKEEHSKAYIYKSGRQCAYVQKGTQNSLILKINPGVDPLLMVCITAILDEA